MQGGGLLRQVSNSNGSPAPMSTSLLIKQEDLEMSQRGGGPEEEIPPVWTPPGVPPSPKSQRKFRPVRFSGGGGGANSNVPSSPTSTRSSVPMPTENGESMPSTTVVSSVSSPLGDSQKPLFPPAQSPSFTSSSQQYFQHQQAKFQAMSQITQSTTTTMQQQSSSNSSQLYITSPPTPGTPTGSTSSTSQQLSQQTANHLPRYQSPTVTLLQKAREGQLPKGAAYLEQTQDKRINGSNETSIPLPQFQLQAPPQPPASQIQFNPAYAIRSYSDNIIPPHQELRRSRSAQNANDPPINIPLTSKYSLSGEKEQREWYRKMYESLHVEKKREIANKKCSYPAGRIKAGPPAKSFWAKRMHSSGAQSEPEDELSYFGQAEEEEYDFNKFGNKVLSPSSPSSATFKTPGAIRFTPGRIEDYNPTTGAQTSNTRKQRYFRQMQPDLKKHWALSSPISSGYESDSNYIIRKRSETTVQDEPPLPPPLSPAEQRQLYLEIQKGGEVPLQGLRKLVGPHHNNVQDEFRTTSPSTVRYNESTVNIHYRAPVRIEEKEFVAEDELRRRQETAMKKFYEEQRKLKYMREIEDMERRRHSDNFAQKSPIPLNRYEEGEDSFDGLVDNRPPRPSSGGLWQRERMTPEPGSGNRVNGSGGKSSLNLLARALYNFTAQSPKELELVKGDIVTIRRKIDANWYEGELRHPNGPKAAVFTYSSSSSALGIFPVSYVQILSDDATSQIRQSGGGGKQSEGLARVLYNFRPSTALELQLSKGEMVILTRRIDSNWFEGRRQKGPAVVGIFPVNYVDIVKEIGATNSSKSPKPVGTPVAHSLNYSSNQKHHYKPNEFVLQDESSDYGDVFSPVMRSPAVGGGIGGCKNDRNRKRMNQRLELITIDTRLNNDQPFRYRAVYNYKPVHSDELELAEDDIIEVMEKCDDGWFVGTSTRTGLFGTFPGNYVERIN